MREGVRERMRKRLTGAIFIGESEKASGDT